MTYKELETLGAALIILWAMWFVIEQTILVNRKRRARK
jgi:hypothetical protein